MHLLIQKKSSFLKNLIKTKSIEPNQNKVKSPNIYNSNLHS